MKVSKLYIKMFLAFLVVLLAAELVVFKVFLSDTLPPPFIRHQMEKSGMTVELVKREMSGLQVSPQAALDRLQSLIVVLGEGIRGDIWLTDAGNTLMASSFAGGVPEMEYEWVPVEHEYGEDARLFTANVGNERATYMESDIRFETAPPMTLHILTDKHPRKEEEWFFNGLLLLTLISALFIIPVSLSVTKPVLQLAETAERLGKGDFSGRVSERGNDEVTVLARKFNAMANSLEQMVRSGKELTAHLSHELRTPLARMRVSLQMVMDRREAGGKADVELLRKMEGEIENMDALIGHILELSKMDMREPRPRQDRVDLAALIRVLLDRFEPMVEQRGLRVRTTLSKVPKILCNGNDINVLLDNVLGNAVKYTADGRSILVALRHKSGQVELSVCNDHAPLSDEELQAMFTPFRRLGNGKADGTGLGLAMSRKIVEVHGGTIKARYESGRACVLVTLPTQD